MSSCKDRLLYKDEFGDIHTVDKINGKRIGDKAIKSKLFNYEQEEADGKLIHLLCKVGDTVYVISNCENVFMYHDNDYFTGTGAIECPYEFDCEFEDCNDTNERIFATVVTGIYQNESTNGEFYIQVKGLNVDFTKDDIGKTIFFIKEKAEQALKE